MTITIDTLELPPQTEWVNRYQWSPVRQHLSETLGGRVVVQTLARVTGRPIDLVAAEGVQRLDQETVDALRAMADQAGATFALTIDDAEPIAVMFRHHDAPAFEAAPARPHAGERLGYYATLRLVTV